jgi:3-dehydroquinate dehydratase/shikimate dehydrogenase
VTLLVASVQGHPGETTQGADVIEFRLDLCEDGADIAAMLDACSLPAIVTCRSREEGGLFEGDEDERISLYHEALKASRPPRYIDIEYEALLRREDLIEELAVGECGVILSWHGPSGRPADLLQRAERMQAIDEAAVVKLAWTARSVRDNVEAFELLQSRTKPMIAICMGSHGLLSRVLAPKFGAFATFAAADENHLTASGQPTVRALLDCYRLRDIDRDTRVYGVIGDPIEHSASPAYHNAAFADDGRNAVLVPMPVPAGWESCKATLLTMIDAAGLDFRGAAVTMPHKANLVRLFRETGGNLDAASRLTGTANTLIISDDQRSCVNTDLPAAVEVLGGDLSGHRVLLLGAGGVARSIGAGVLDAGGTVAVAARNAEQAAALASDLGCHVAVEGEPATIVVNCTPLGMGGETEADSDPAEALVPWLSLVPPLIVFDTVYEPSATPLLRRATAAGCETIPGRRLFDHQAALQQTAWRS